MNNYNFNSKRYVLLMIIVLLMFTIFIVKAFDYLPDKNTDTNDFSEHAVASNINSPATVTISENENKSDEKETEEYKERHKSGHFDFMPKTEYDNQTFAEIQAPPGTNEDKISIDSDNSVAETADDKALKCIINAKNYYDKEDYANALSEFQKVDELTTNSELKAQAYEGIAGIYAHNRRFGTALSFANKAYNTAPSPSREMTIARINYLSGNPEAAITKMNNILKQGF